MARGSRCVPLPSSGDAGAEPGDDPWPRGVGEVTVAQHAEGCVELGVDHGEGQARHIRHPLDARAQLALVRGGDERPVQGPFRRGVTGACVTVASGSRMDSTTRIGSYQVGFHSTTPSVRCPSRSPCWPGLLAGMCLAGVCLAGGSRPAGTPAPLGVRRNARRGWAVTREGNMGLTVRERSVLLGGGGPTGGNPPSAVDRG